MIRAWSWLILAFAILAGTVGCGKAGRPKMTTYPVSGKLTIAGKAAPNLSIILSPKSPLADPRFAPAAVVGDDGSFVVQTYDTGDGAPAGEYLLFVRARIEMSANPRKFPQEAQEILNRHQGEPGSPGGMKPVAEIVVKPGANVIDPIDLK